ncbi:hypothetical protein HKX48_004851 [Thoreauomyces humboldtii]|nr:hypothetical protein HKX48_004851 [Thoreauomyces humboldtii]
MSTGTSENVALPAAMSCTEVHSAVRTLCDSLNAKYVFSEIAGQIITVLQENLGDYEQYAGSQQGTVDLATRLEQDLRSVNNDLHLGVTVSLEVLDVQQDEEEEADEDEDGPVDEEHPTHPMWKNIELFNNGLDRADRLPGNVGVLAFSVLAALKFAGPVISAAFTVLANTSALILDLRNCRGGDGDCGDFLLGHMIAGNRHVNTSYWRPSDTTTQSWIVGHTAAPQYLGGRPIYVLTSPTTFSCGEKVAGSMKSIGRAVLLGATTRGGGHPCEKIPIASHLEASISIGRTTSEITGRGWEGSGVVPHIPTDEALDVAHALALTQLKAQGFADVEGKDRMSVRFAGEITDELERLLKIPEVAAKVDEFKDIKPVRETKEKPPSPAREVQPAAAPVVDTVSAEGIKPVQETKEEKTTLETTPSHAREVQPTAAPAAETVSAEPAFPVVASASTVPASSSPAQKKRGFLSRHFAIIKPNAAGHAAGQ